MNTPRTEDEFRKRGVIDETHGGMVNTDFARTLERELNQRNHDNRNLMETIRHLESKLADAKRWIEATVQNCSVFSDPPDLA